MGMQQEQFEDLEREFKQFLEEIVGNNNMELFRQQYQNIHDTLKSTYDQELIYIKKCKQTNNQIFDKASNVRAAIRMASSEVERIAALNTKMREALDEVENQRKKEETQRERITQLRKDLTILKIQKEEDVELTEEQQLKSLREKYEDLLKAREE